MAGEMRGEHGPELDLPQTGGVVRTVRPVVVGDHGHPWHPDCDHPGEFLRMGDHPDMTGRFIPDDLEPDELYCLKCERTIHFSAEGG